MMVDALPKQLEGLAALPRSAKTWKQLGISPTGAVVQQLQTWSNLSPSRENKVINGDT